MWFAERSFFLNFYQIEMVRRSLILCVAVTMVATVCQDTVSLYEKNAKIIYKILVLMRFPFLRL